MEETKSIFKNIWLVDDDEDDHLVFENAIQTVLPSATVTYLYKCAELLLLIDQGIVPDLLFLDLHLPFIDGTTYLKHLSEANKLTDLRIIVYSGSSYQSDIDNSYQQGLFYTSSSLSPLPAWQHHLKTYSALTGMNPKR
jgi:CheY-like chemotaxis protein